MQESPSSSHHVPSPTLGSTPLPSHPPPPSQRLNRLLYRRGLPDLPELIEVEEDEPATVTDDGSMNTFSTRHSASTSASSREFSPWTTFTAGGVPLSPKQVIPPQSRPIQHPPYEIFTQTPPGSVPQLQTPFEYNPSNSFRFNPRLRDEASPPPSPSPRDEALLYAGIGYGLGVTLNALVGAGVVDEGAMPKSQDQLPAIPPSSAYGDSDCSIEGSFGGQAPLRHPFGPYHHSTSMSDDVDAEIGDYMSPPSSPGSDCIFILW